MIGRFSVSIVLRTRGMNTGHCQALIGFQYVTTSRSSEYCYLQYHTMSINDDVSRKSSRITVYLSTCSNFSISYPGTLWDTHWLCLSLRRAFACSQHPLLSEMLYYALSDWSSDSRVTVSRVVIGPVTARDGGRRALSAWASVNTSRPADVQSALTCGLRFAGAF